MYSLISYIFISFPLFTVGIYNLATQSRLLNKLGKKLLADVKSQNVNEYQRKESIESFESDLSANIVKQGKILCYIVFMIGFELSYGCLTLQNRTTSLALLGYVLAGITVLYIIICTGLHERTIREVSSTKSVGIKYLIPLLHQHGILAYIVIILALFPATRDSIASQILNLIGKF
jgi:hypothetical protein